MRRMSYEDTRKREIIDSAFALAKTVPCDQLTMSAICANAHISKSTFYKYFKSKEELFSFLYVSADSQLLLALPSILLADAPALQKYWSIWRFYIDRTIEAGPGVIEYVAKSGYIQQTHTFFYTEHAPITEMLYKLLEKSQQQGEIRRDVSFQALHQIYHYFLVGLDIDWSNRQAPFDYLQAVYTGMMDIFGARPTFGPGDVLAA